MSIILIATPDQQTAEKSKISWLFEDIWTDDKGDGDILLECIIESHDALKEIYMVLPYKVTRVDDLSYLYSDTSFIVDGYPYCWLDIYHQFEVEQNKGDVVTINGITAKVGLIQVSIEESSLKSSMIKVKFDHTLQNNESTIFKQIKSETRIGMAGNVFNNLEAFRLNVDFITDSQCNGKTCTGGWPRGCSG